jgi:hypothetical protein
MGDAFRRIFLGLGVALGLASGQPDPSIFASVSAADEALILYARVEKAFAPGALELIESGTQVALRYTAQVEGADGRVIETSQTRALWYDLRSGMYYVSIDGTKKGDLVDPQAARTLVAELRGLALCRAAEVAPDGRAVVKAEIGILDGRGGWHDAPVLWNYSYPRTVIVLRGEGPAQAPGPGESR